MLLLQGRTEFLEKYDETARDLTAAGYVVWSMDWFGQGLSTRPLADRECHHVDSYCRYLDDLDRLIAHVAACDGTPRLAMAHSMGGHILLRHAAERRHDWAAIALSAPMVNILTEHPRPIVRAVVWLAARLGLARRYALGQRPAGTAAMPYENNPLTRSRKRFDSLIAQTEADPRLRLGGVSWGWLDATFRSIAALAPAGPRIFVPSLIGLGGAERIVDNAAAGALARSMPSADVIAYPKARHELLMETDEVRTSFLNAAVRHFQTAGEQSSPAPPLAAH